MALAAELDTLRSIISRISSTTTISLPKIVPSILSDLGGIGFLLSSTSGSKTSSEASTAVHKYRTLLSTLLQDRSFQGRWTSIVLIKSTIEIGGHETLSKCLPWVRGLIGMLAKPDPPSSKQLCVILLTRIFTLTKEYPTLVREITTPSLPAFIQSALQVAAFKAPSTLLETILSSFNELFPRHPTTFRSYLKQIQELLHHTIAPTPSNTLSPEQAPVTKYEASPTVSAAARRLYTQLPCSAPKGAVSEEWEVSFRKTVISIHYVASKVFRAVVEDSPDALTRSGETLDNEVEEIINDSMSLPPWSGIFAGGERLVNLLGLVEAFLICPTSAPVTLPFGSIATLLTRIFALTVPATGNQSFQNVVKFNNQVGKEERGNLWLILPKVHVAAINILIALTKSTHPGTISMDTLFLDQITWVFSAERKSHSVRTACYQATASILERSGASLPKSSVDPLAEITRHCCEDLLSVEEYGSNSQNSAKTNGSTNATAKTVTFLNGSKRSKNIANSHSDLRNAASSLLPILFTIPSQHLSDSLRTRIDRTAILTGHTDAMIASVQNPPRSRKFGKPAASILPLLARIAPASTKVEMLLRPRMPVVMTSARGNNNVDEDEEEEDEQEESAEVSQGAIEEDAFIGHELDALLDTVENPDPVIANIPKVDDVQHAPTPAFIAATLPDISMADSPASDDAPNAPDNPVAVSKRSSDPESPFSPSKRLRLGEPQNYGEIANDPNSQLRASVAQPDKSQIAVSAQHFIAPTEAPKQEIEDSDSDGDDAFSLVLGLDTDDDSG